MWKIRNVVYLHSSLSPLSRSFDAMSICDDDLRLPVSVVESHDPRFSDEVDISVHHDDLC